ncbi:MAG: aminotransferase class V-fold PLP-dependent enzyme [Gemmatimonadetes bacterium]|nr:aminotransferase class V-fold PLP-dependent enzyme [Gemmatimonadota bacterium]
MTLFDRAALAHLDRALARLETGFRDLPPAATPDDPRIAAVLDEVADRLHDNFPYPHPLYAGQMLTPPHRMARLAYMLALHLNPNNHALDGGRASSRMERESVATLATLLGWTEHLGHLTSGGTMANLEALWVAGQCRPGERIVASAQAHYTHQRISAVLGLPFSTVAADRAGRMDLEALRALLDTGPVGTVVATLGTTAVGAVDPLPGLLALQHEAGFRIHVDAAYGGYFGLADNLAPAARAAFDVIGAADSVVIDPHKHGLQPYGCGAVLFRDPSVGRFYRHDSPYTYFSSAELHLGEISLECSRAGAAAVALWATQRLLPPVPGGEFAGRLATSRAAALALHGRLAADPRVLAGLVPELDIVVWTPRAAGVAAASARSRRIFEEAARRDLYLALAELPPDLVDPAGELVRDRPTLTCLRSVLMKPEHLAWLPALWERLSAATDAT